MRVHVLGAAAGGGFPQWNCNCRNCRGLRDGSLSARRRTQSSIAVSADGARWTLVNASPDILQQFQAFAGTWPTDGLRGCGVESIVLVDAQIDHTTGLYMLREKGSPWPIWCTDPVYEDLTRGNPILHLLDHYCGIDRQPLPLDGRSFHPQGSASLDWYAMPLLSAAPPYSPHRGNPVPGDNVGLTIHDPASGLRVVAMDEARIRAAGITLDTAGPATVASSLQLPGEIRFDDNRTAHVVPRVSGVVERVAVDLGQSVKRGQVLAVISSAAISDLRSEQLAATRRLELARANHQREKALWEAKVTAEQQLRAAVAGQPHGTMVGDAIFVALAAELVPNGEHRRRVAGAAGEAGRVRRALEFIHAHLTDPLDIAAISGIVSVSR